MAYTEQDEKDLRAIAKQRKDSPVTSFLTDSDEYKRQFGKGKREAKTEPTPAIKRPMGGNNPAN